jgi:hypothetical protein
MQADQPQPQIAVDPNLAAEQEQAKNTMIDSLQSQAQIDTASLMARYGTRLALAGGGMAPIDTSSGANPYAGGDSMLGPLVAGLAKAVPA